MTSYSFTSPSDDMSSSSSLSLSNESSLPTGRTDEQELNEFLLVEQQKAEMRSQIQRLTDICWDKCVDKPTSRMEAKTESCFDNCAARFVDVSLLITNRFAQLLQRSGHGGL